MQREEIVVTVGGVVCTDRGSDTDDVNTVSIFQSHVYLTYDSRPFLTVQYVCSPPSQPPDGHSEAPVVVYILHILMSYFILMPYLLLTGPHWSEPQI